MQKKLLLFSILLFFITLNFAICQEFDNENLQIPKCPKDAILITKENSQNILETLEKKDSHQIIEHSGFTLCYREKYEIPEWVCYTIDKQKLKKNVKRKDNFRSDPDVITKSASNADYKNSGFDKGHLAPCGDLTYSFESMNDSFYFSNMTPQTPSFNRGIWKNLETEVRKFADFFDILYIVTGPILEKENYQTIGQNQVAIPEYFYKAILALKDNQYYMIGFIIPNQKSYNTDNSNFMEVNSDSTTSNSFWDYAVCVDKIEERTKIDFFYKLDDNIENALEKSCNIADFKFKENFDE